MTPAQVTLVGLFERDGTVVVLDGEGREVAAVSPADLGACLVEHLRGGGGSQVEAPKPVQSLVGAAAAAFVERHAQRLAPGALDAINVFIRRSRALSEKLDSMRAGDDALLRRQEARRS